MVCFKQSNITKYKKQSMNVFIRINKSWLHQQSYHIQSHPSKLTSEPDTSLRNHVVFRFWCQPYEVTQTPRLMGFSGRFLSQQNTDSPESFLCASSLLWFSCQRTPALRSSRDLFPRPTTENCVLLPIHLRGLTVGVETTSSWVKATIIR